MSKIGTGELLVILGIALLIFGPAKLPELGRTLGKTLGTIKHYAKGLEPEMDLFEEPKPKKKAKKPKEDAVSIDMGGVEFTSEELALEPEPVAVEADSGGGNRLESDIA